MNEWKNQIENIEDYVGFVYKIFEIDTGMIYFGITRYFRTDRLPQKRSATESEKLKLEQLKKELKEKNKWRVGRNKHAEELKVEAKILTLKKNIKKRISKLSGGKRSVVKEMDWRNYNTSSKIVQEKLEKNPDNYEKVILKNCKSLTELKAFEAFYQLEYYIRGDWDKLYNEYIGFKLRIRK